MRQRPGVVLVAVMVVAAMVAVVAASLVFRMRAEVSASAAQERGEQAYEAALSGLQYAMAVLKGSSADMTVWYDNPDLFLNQFVADDGASAWYFTIYGDDPEGQDTVRYGVSDEAGKVNLNTAGPEQLLALPNLTDELVDSLVDYRDADDEPGQNGAEQEYYDNLPHPYVIPNGPVATLEELLLVKGFNGPIVYGEDANFNGILDPNEDDGEDAFPPDNRDGRLDRGLRGIATVYTAEPNVDNEGRARIDLNAGVPSRGVDLPDAAKQFILVYLAEGNRFKHPSELLEARYEVKQEHKDVPAAKPGQTLESGVGPDELPAILDRLTVPPESGQRNRLIGLVNVNTAPAEALAAVPGLDPNMAQQIVDVRRDLDPEVRATPAWLYTQNLLTAEEFKKVAPYVTARSFQFSVRCVGFGVPCGRFRVLEAVLDLSGRVPRVAYLRDITRLGLPFALDPNQMERTR